MPTATISPLTLYYTTPPTATTGYTNLAIPTTLNSTTLTQDQRVLTYALAAELLEFQLYLQAYLYVTGQSITIGGTTYTNVTDALGYVYGTGSATVNGAMVTAINLGSTGTPIDAYLAEFAAIEYAHGQFLISALGGNPYAQPAGSAVEFAFGLHTLTTAIEVEDAVYGAELTGVSDYLGAIPSFTTKSPYLQTAASIQGTEARHTAALAAAINATNSNGAIETAPYYNEGFPTSDPHGIDVPLTPDQILNTGGSGVPGVLTGTGSSAASVGGSGGTLGPITGPSGPAVGAANTTAYPSGTLPSYNGYVYLVTTPVG